jgi:hypothetical protein
MRFKLRFGFNFFQRRVSAPSGSALLLETGDYLLLETGDKILLE